MSARDQAHAAYLRGMREFNRGERERALDFFDVAIAVDDSAEGWLGRGLVLTELGREDEALAAFDRALRARPGYARAWWHKGIVLEGSGRLDDALEAYDRALGGDFDGDEIMRPVVARERAELAVKVLSRRLGGAAGS